MAREYENISSWYIRINFFVIEETKELQPKKFYRRCWSQWRSHCGEQKWYQPRYVKRNPILDPIGIEPIWRGNRDCHRGVSTCYFVIFRSRSALRTGSEGQRNDGSSSWERGASQDNFVHPLARSLAFRNGTIDVCERRRWWIVRRKR